MDMIQRKGSFLCSGGICRLKMAFLYTNNLCRLALVFAVSNPTMHSDIFILLLHCHSSKHAMRHLRSIRNFLHDFVSNLIYRYTSSFRIIFTSLELKLHAAFNEYLYVLSAPFSCDAEHTSWFSKNDPF